MGRPSRLSSFLGLSTGAPRWLGLIGAAALIAASCSSGADSGDGTAASSNDSAPATTAASLDCALGGDGEQTIDVVVETDTTDTTSGAEAAAAEPVTRTYDLYLPDDLATMAEPAPVLVLFHGFTSSKEVIAAYTGLGSLAPDRGVVLVVPQGLGEPTTWGVLAGLVEDEAFINALLDEVTASPCVDTDNVWLTGHSAGSAFSAVFGCRNAERIAGMGLNAGLPPPICKSGTPDVLITNGTDDAVVPFDGGAQRVGEVDIPLASIPDSAAGWAELARCEADPTTANPYDDLSVTTWSGCERGEVVLQAIEGGGHSWPGALDLPPPRQATQSFNGSCVLLDRITGYEGDTYEHCAGPIEGSTT